MADLRLCLANLSKEAQVFGYDKRAVQIMQQLYPYDPQATPDYFTMLMAPLMVFVRKIFGSERHSVIFSLKQLRGIKRRRMAGYNPLYTMADAVRASGVMSRFCWI